MRMTSKHVPVVLTLAVAMAFGLLVPACGRLLLNQTAERTGNISLTFINDTPYRASFSYGTWDSLDRNPVGPVNFRQLRLAGSSSSAVLSLSCARNFAIATQELLTRVIDTDADQTATFDPDAFDTTVHFSDQPQDSDLAAVATVGTAVGVEKLLGPDFECGDRLVFTFVEDPDVTGGFRIDYALIRAEP